MRPIASLLLALALMPLASAPARAARREAPVTVLVSATVAESARRAMSPELWARLVAEYVSATKIVPVAGTGLPTLADCKAASAAYAISATFELAPRLPGLAQDSDRKYAIGHINVLNCITGTVVPERVVRFESDPLSSTNASEFTWARTVHDQLGKVPSASASPKH